MKKQTFSQDLQILSKYVDLEKLDKHISLCKKNLNTKRIQCCLQCPFEKIITLRHPEFVQKFHKAKTRI
jgi:hypothetical protein